jgi:hypothetical protein
MFYLVRTQTKLEAVGIYHAKSIENLRQLVDEFTNPNECSYLKLPEGGFTFKNECSSVPISDEDGDGVESLLDEIDGITEVLIDSFIGYTNSKWKDLRPGINTWTCTGIIDVETEEFITGEFANQTTPLHSPPNSV